MTLCTDLLKYVIPVNIAEVYRKSCEDILHNLRDELNDVNMSCRKISSNVPCFPELSDTVISQSLLRSSPRFPISLPQSSVTGGVFFCRKHS